MAISAEEKNFTPASVRLRASSALVRAISGNAEHPSDKYNRRSAAITNGPLAAQVSRPPSRLYDEQHAANIRCPWLFPKCKRPGKFPDGFRENLAQPIEEIEKLPRAR